MRLSSILAAVSILTSQQWPVVFAGDIVNNRVNQDHAPDRHLRVKTAPADPIPGTRTVKCVLIEKVAMYVESRPKHIRKDREDWKCEFKDDSNVVKTILGLPKKYFRKHRSEIEAGATMLTFSFPDFGGNTTGVFAPPSDGEGAPPNDEWAIPEGSVVRLEQIADRRDIRHRRTAIRSEGDHSTLIIRVTDVDGVEPDPTAAELAEDIFGGPTDNHNLKSQYAACSGGKLRFTPATGYDFVNGVAELNIPHAVSFQAASVVENWVSIYATEEFDDLNQWDLVLYVLPGTVNFSGAAAYTYVGAHHSVYLDRFSSNLLVLMHEIGHNFLNRHSGEGALSYGDGTCMMGAHVYEDEAPQMCFNGAKSWYFGWYSDRHATMDSSTLSWEGQLIGIDDYLNNQSTDPNQVVVLRLESTVASDLFIMYNRKEGVNKEVHEMGDMVTVVEQGGPSEQSWLLDGLSESTPPYRYPNWNGGADLVIEVCARVAGTPDIARVIVYSDDGTNNLSCSGNGGNTPASAPTPRPTSRGAETVDLTIQTGFDDYREKDNGIMTKGALNHILFEPQWNLQAFRFEAGTTWGIPAKATIESASIMVIPEDTRPGSLDDSMDAYAVGHANGNPAGYSDADFSISYAPKTAATVTLDPSLPAWTDGTETELVDVAPIVQELVNRGDYTQQNPIEIFLIGSATNVGRGRTIKTMNTNVQTTLRVTYTLSPEAQQLEDWYRSPVVVLDILDARDDYRETDVGAIGAFSKTHNLWTDTHEKQAYRFQNSPIPRGAEILEASFEMMAKTDYTLDHDISGYVQGEDVGDSPEFAFIPWRITDAPKTQASVAISDLPDFTVDKYNHVADVSPILQEIVDRTDYALGNAIKLFMINNGSTSFRRVKTFDSGAGAKLIVRYRE